MNPTRLRHIAHRYGTPGLLFVGGVLLLQSLKHRKAFMLAGCGIAILSLSFLFPHNCHRSSEPDVFAFTPQTEPAEETSAYRVVDLGTLPGGDLSEATAVNSSGQVIGISAVSEEAFHGFVWDGGKLRDLGTFPGGALSIALGINDSAQVVGIGDDRHGNARGFLWDKGKMRDLGHLGGGLTLATSINNRGGIVGISVTKEHTGHAFIWQDGRMRDIGTPKGCDFSVGQDVNDAGTVVGIALNSKGRTTDYIVRNIVYVLPDKFWAVLDVREYRRDPKRIAGSWFARLNEANSMRGFVWKNGKFVDLRGKRDQTIAISLNNRGTVAGAEFSEQDESVRAMLWESENGTELPLPSGFSDSFAVDIADDGAIVGGAFSDKDVTACLWKGGKAYDLNKMLPSGSGWTLYFAEGINRKGQIVGVGEKDGKIRAFLLEPRG